MTASDRPMPTIMVVDDDEDIRYMMRVLLEEDGYRVLEAENGQRALEVAQAAYPDLILMDLSMPVLDGFDATRRLRELTKISDVPIIAITAHDTPEHRTNAYAAGINEYLTKPVDFVKLDKLLDQFLNAA
jgi:two-component system, cell cycle response regulator DivK